MNSSSHFVRIESIQLSDQLPGRRVVPRARRVRACQPCTAVRKSSSSAAAAPAALPSARRPRRVRGGRSAPPRVLAASNSRARPPKAFERKSKQVARAAGGRTMSRTYRTTACLLALWEWLCGGSGATQPSCATPLAAAWERYRATTHRREKCFPARARPTPRYGIIVSRSRFPPPFFPFVSA